MTTSKQPTTTIRDGAIKATLWQHEGKKGPFFVTEISRTYRDKDGVFHERHGYSGTELLKVARMAQLAYDAEQDLRQSIKAKARLQAAG